MVDDHYAGGYATSKWAAEHVLRAASEELGVPVTVLRGPMMLPHRREPGEINTGDMFTRLLVSIILTGLAPRTFYRRHRDGSVAPGHYDGLPVDVVAAAVVAAAAATPEGFRAVNVSNLHADDGASLDAFVDWIVSAGYPVERIDEYGAWFERFRAALEALPADRKQASALDVLGAYAVPHRPAAPGAVAVGGFHRLLADAAIGELPHLDEAYLHKAIADLRHLGLIPPARQVH